MEAGLLAFEIFVLTAEAVEVVTFAARLVVGLFAACFRGVIGGG